MIMMRSLRRLFQIILLVLILLLAVLMYIGMTQSGTQLAFKIAQKYLHNHLIVAEIEGKLLSEIHLQHMTYEDDRLKLSMEKIDLNWQALHLLQKKLVVDDLKIAGVKVTLKQHEQVNTAPKNNSHPFSLPVALVLKNINFSNLVIDTENNKPVQIAYIMGHAVIERNISAALSAQLQSPSKLTAHFNTAGTQDQYQWDIALQGNQIDWLAKGQGGKNNIVLQMAKGRFLEGELSMLGHLTWAPVLDWQFSAIAKSLNLNKLSNAAPKNLSFAADGKGDAQHIDFNIMHLQATQKNIPLRADLKLEADLKKSGLHEIADLRNNLAFKVKATMRWGEWFADLYGDLGKIWDLNYQLNIGSLKQAIPSMQGHINCKGTVTGDALNPELNNTFTLQQLKSLESIDSVGIAHVQGKLLSRIQLEGTFKDPQINGNFNLISDKIQLLQPNLKLKSLNIKANIKDNRAHYEGSLFSGPGQIQLKGTTSFAKAKISSQLAINGKQFLIDYAPRLQVYISPNLTIENKEHAWYAQGKIEIPTAEITWPNVTQAITLPKETVIIKSTGDITKKDTSDTFTDITLLLGPKVHIKTSGLDSFIVGKLRIQDRPGAEAMANGRLEFKEGSYDLKGQKLKLEQSNIAFTNSAITNPNLHIRAAKTIHTAPSNSTLMQDQSFVVGVQVTGNAENPNITLFSEPPNWSQPDILSLIVLGQPANAVSQGNVQLLAAAASALTPENGNSVNQITQQIQQAFGLSKVGIESGVSKEPGENNQSTSFVLGKYLSPRLYLSYSIGVLNSVNTLRLKYLLSKHWSVQTQSNILGSGADILYSIEY